MSMVMSPGATSKGPTMSTTGSITVRVTPGGRAAARFESWRSVKPMVPTARKTTSTRLAAVKSRASVGVANGTATTAKMRPAPRRTAASTGMFCTTPPST